MFICSAIMGINFYAKKNSEVTPTIFFINIKSQIIFDFIYQNKLFFHSSHIQWNLCL